MTKYRVIGIPAQWTPEAAALGGRGIGDEFDGDFSDDEERRMAGAGVIERVDGDTLQPETPGSGAETMDAPPHTAEPGVGFQDVSGEQVGAEPAPDAEPAAGTEATESRKGARRGTADKR